MNLLLAFSTNLLRPESIPHLGKMQKFDQYLKEKERRLK